VCRTCSIHEHEVRPLNNFASIAIKQDLPKFADDIIAAEYLDPGLMGALKDYEQACKRMNDTLAQPEDRALWAEIRAELAAEIGRLYLVLMRERNSSAR